MEAIESERRVTSWATSLEKLLNDTVGLHVFAVSIYFWYLCCTNIFSFRALFGGKMPDESVARMFFVTESYDEL